MEFKDIEELFARLEDIKKRAARSELGISAFLSPRELHYAEKYLNASGNSFFTFGGFDTAERKRIYILPEYMADDTDVKQLEDFGYSSEVSAVRVCGSGFEKLSHRAIMGSVLGLGVQRSVIGDIVLEDDNNAIIICDAQIKSFLLLELQRVGRDKVKVFETELPPDFLPDRKYAPISDTVASPRLDCVVAAICSLSREKARQTVENGLVEVDYERQERPEREIAPTCVISVKGYGKFRITSLNDKTKKGRYRLLGEKFL